MSLALRRGLAVIVIALMASGSATYSQGAPGRQEQPLGAISGVVIDLATKRPISGAMVTLGPESSARDEPRQLTDDRGRFIFIGLPAANDYTLFATKAGYLWKSVGGRLPSYALAPNQWLANQTLELIPESAISGRVSDERGEPIVGARVRVIALLPIAGRVHPVNGPLATTDDRGVYRIAGLREGRYLVAVPSVQHTVPVNTPARVMTGASAAQAARTSSATSAVGPPAMDFEETGHRLIIGSYVTPPAPTAGGRPQAYPTTYYPDVRGFAESTPISLAAGEHRDGVDLQLRPVPTWRVEGRIEPSPGMAAGFPLRLLPGGSEDLGFGSEIATTLVEGNGRFTFLNVPEGRYAIVARGAVMAYEYSPAGFTIDRANALPQMPGFGSRSGSMSGWLDSAPVGTAYRYSLGDWDQTVWARADVEVTNRDVTGVQVPLQRLAELRGQIRWDRTTDAPPPEAPAPPLPATPLTVDDGMRQTIISADPADGALWLGRPSAAMMPDHRFTLSGLLPGQYLLRVRGPSGVPFSVKSITWQGADYTHAPFDASAMTDIADVVITLTDQVQSITGVVSGVATGVEGAAVIAFPIDPGHWRHYGLDPVLIQSVRTSASGRYTLTLPTGDFYLIAVDGAQRRAWIDPAFLKAASRVATRVSLASGEEKMQDLRIVEVLR